jgi:hypothetical protein
MANDPQQEMDLAQAAEKSASHAADAAERYNQLESAARHRAQAAYGFRRQGDICEAAEAWAARSDDLAAKAGLAAQAGHAGELARIMEEAEKAAKHAAQCYEICAQREEDDGRKVKARLAWLSASTYWIRVQLYFDRIRRVEMVKRMRETEEKKAQRHAQEEQKAQEEASDAQRKGDRDKERADSIKD